MTRYARLFLVLALASCGGSDSGNPSAPSGGSGGGSVPNLAGNYFFSYRVSSSCAAIIPPVGRNHLFSAVVTHAGSNVAAQLEGPFLYGTGAVQFNVVGNQIVGNLFLSINYGGPSGFAAVQASLTGTPDAQGFSGTSSGIVAWSTAFAAPQAQCTAADHQFSFIRR